MLTFPPARLPAQRVSHRALAWCHEGREHDVDSLHGPTSSATTPARAGARGNSRIVKDFLAMGTSTGHVLVCSVQTVPGVSTSRHFSSERDGGRATRACLSVVAHPLTMICQSDGRPVAFLTFVMPGNGREEEQGAEGDGAGEDMALPVSLSTAIFLLMIEHDESCERAAR